MRKPVEVVGARDVDGEVTFVVRGKGALEEGGGDEEFAHGQTTQLCATSRV